jgi:hypothetical protein
VYVYTGRACRGVGMLEGVYILVELGRGVYW